MDVSGAEQAGGFVFAELAATLRLKGGRYERIAEGLDSYGEPLTPLGLVPFLGAWTERLRRATGPLQRYRTSVSMGSAATRRSRPGGTG